MGGDRLEIKELLTMGISVIFTELGSVAQHDCNLGLMFKFVEILGAQAAGSG